MSGTRPALVALHLEVTDPQALAADLENAEAPREHLTTLELAAEVIVAKVKAAGLPVTAWGYEPELTGGARLTLTLEHPTPATLEEQFTARRAASLLGLTVRRAA